MLAYGENNYQPGETDIRRPLVAHLRRMMPDVHFQFVEYELPALSEAVKRCGEDGRVALEHYQKRSESSLASGHEKQGIPAFSGCGRN